MLPRRRGAATSSSSRRSSGRSAAACASSTARRSGSTRSSTPPATGSASPSSLPRAGGRRPRLVPIPADRSSGGARAVSRRASSPRRAGYSRWWRLPVVETQEEWIAAVLTGRLRLPPRAQMDWAIERAERRTRQRFPQESPRSVRCDPHAYRRLPQSDLRRARRRVWHVATATDAGHEIAVRPQRPRREQPAA